MCDTSQKIMLDMLKNGDKYRAIRNKWTADHHDCCLWEVLDEKCGHPGVRELKLERCDLLYNGM